jgi:hypothetical protein
MVAKGNKDAHRYSYSGGVKAQETEKWGRDTAARRYGEPQSPNMKPKDACYPQKLGDANNLQAPNYYSGEPKQDWRGGFGKNGVESAESKPGYVPGFKGRK